jgi:hypothetical protein
MLRQWRQRPLGAGRDWSYCQKRLRPETGQPWYQKYDDNLAVLPEEEFSAKPDDPTACNFHPHNLKFHPLI